MPRCPQHNWIHQVNKRLARSTCGLILTGWAITYLSFICILRSLPDMAIIGAQNHESLCSVMGPSTKLPRHMSIQQDSCWFPAFSSFLVLHCAPDGGGSHAPRHLLTVNGFPRSVGLSPLLGSLPLQEWTHLHMGNAVKE